MQCLSLSTPVVYLYSSACSSTGHTKLSHVASSFLLSLLHYVIYNLLLLYSDKDLFAKFCLMGPFTVLFDCNFISVSFLWAEIRCCIYLISEDCLIILLLNIIFALQIFLLHIPRDFVLVVYVFVLYLFVVLLSSNL